MRVCPHCRKEFTGIPTQIYCKFRCAQNAGKKRYTKQHGKSAGRRAKEKRAYAARKIRNREYVYRDKLKGCSRCPERRPNCLDYHHLDKIAKRGAISRIANEGRTLQILVDEIAKCILLCANCHRVEEHGDGYRCF
jgi:hypothetical protein